LKVPVFVCFAEEAIAGSGPVPKVTTNPDELATWKAWDVSDIF